MAVSKILFKIDGDDAFYRDQCRKITSISNLLELRKTCEAHLTEISAFDGNEDIMDPDEGYDYQRKDVIERSYMIQRQQLICRLQEIKQEKKKRQKQAEPGPSDGFRKPKRTCWEDVPAPETVPPVPTGNRYECISDHEEETASMEVVETNVKDTELNKGRSPAITLESEVDPDKFLKMLSTINGVELETKCHGNSYTIRPRNLTTFDNIKEKLLTENIAFYTRTPKERKPIKVVLKGFPLNKNEELKGLLQKIGYSPISITQLYKLKEGALPPPYVIALERSSAGDILAIKKLSFYKVKFQNLRRQKGRVLVCYNCQMVGHSSHSCFRKQACFRCGDEHSAKNCSRPQDVAPTCARCKGEHKATSLDCPTLKRTTKPKSNSKRDEKTFNSKKTVVPEDKSPVPEPQKHKKSYAEATKTRVGSQTPQEGPSLEELYGSYKPNRIASFLEAYDLLKSASRTEDIMMLRMDAMAAFLRLPMP